MYGSKVDPVAMRVSIYDKENAETGKMELHGNLILSVTGAAESKTFDMGWCFRPIEQTLLGLYDCLAVRFFYEFEKLQVESSNAYFTDFTGYDLWAPFMD